MRLATWNVEWFNALFDDTGRVMNDAARSARHDTSRAQQLAGLRAVFAAMDADGVLIVEGPDTNSRRSTVTALEAFARWAGLRARRAVHGYTSDSEQEIGFLFDPDRLSVRHDPAFSRDVPRFDGAFPHDVDGDGMSAMIRFSKPPLELALAWAGRQVRVIGVHAKSKSPHGQTSATEFARISVENRRKQLAQCLWIRARAADHLARGDSLIVLGDFNDGPGLDVYERQFGQSGVEIVRGTDGARLFDPHAEMALMSRAGGSPMAAEDGVSPMAAEGGVSPRPVRGGELPTTARFWLSPQKRYFEALLDFIMVSADLVPGAVWRIWHPFNDPEITPDLRKALLAASDHFPVTIDVP